MQRLRRRTGVRDEPQLDLVDTVRARREQRAADPQRVRGVRPIERKVEGRSDAEAEVVRGYCAAVRSALTDDGRPPLEASGLKLQGRLTEVADSLDRVAVKRGFRGN